MANFSTGDRMRKPKGDRFFLICLFNFIVSLHDVDMYTTEIEIISMG